jgi:uncharacterized protein YcfJ
MVSKAMTGVVVSGLLFMGQTAFADHYRGERHVRYDDRYERSERNSGYEYARVVDVDPIIHRVRVSTPRRECYTDTVYEDVRRQGPSTPGATILGGIIGAAVGNQIGRGDGRRAATAAGAIIGATVGNTQAERRNPGYTETRAHDVERCDVRYEERYEERIDGYNVTYVYNGRQSTTRLPYDPGDRIRVRVDVRPDEY